MQASKIDLGGKVYAIRDDAGALQRFRPTSIVTTRTSNGPGASVVAGYLEGDAARTVQVSADKLLGEYTSYVELVARRKAEDDARQAAMVETQTKVEKIVAALDAAGVKANFRHRTVAIESDQLDAMLAFLERTIPA